MKAVIKPQYVDQLPKAIKTATNKTVGALLESKSEMGNKEYIMDVLGQSKSNRSNVITKRFQSFKLSKTENWTCYLEGNCSALRLR